MNQIDILDSQAHLFLTMDEKQALAAMDALGIRSLLIDEYWGLDSQGRPSNGFDLPGGVRRRVHPSGERASFEHPDRFSDLVKLTRDDPLVEPLVALAADHPCVRAVRVDIRSPNELQQLANGGYGAFFKALEHHGMPVFLLLAPDSVCAARRAFEDHPALRLVLDHCGMASSPEKFDDVLAMARYPNAYLKWCHAPSKMSRQPYPFTDAIVQLQRALDAFGRERVLWASDFTAVRTGYTWAESLFYIRHAQGLDPQDMAWLLGKTARRLLDWPIAATTATPTGSTTP